MARKAIITDLDRTLLRNDGTLSEYTLAVLKKCRSLGIPVMAASARPLRSIMSYHRLIGFDAITATNGAVLSLPNGVMEFGIPPEIGERICEKLLRVPDLTLAIETSTGFYANRKIPHWQPIVYDRFPKLPEHCVLYKILVSASDKSFYNNIDFHLPDEVYQTIAGNDLLQIMSKKASKWNGVKHMLVCFNLTPKAAVYFGDDNDDAEPIARCGFGVAAANAIPAVLDIAGEIMASNEEDGVAQYIEKYILSEKI